MTAYKWVPLEPTEEMINSGFNAQYPDRESDGPVEDIIRSANAAAPEPDDAVVERVARAIERAMNEYDWTDESLARAAMAAMSECGHEWIDIRNAAIESGEMCRKCNAVRPGNATSEDK